MDEAGRPDNLVGDVEAGTGRAGEAARKAALAAIEDLRAGKPIFVGPLKDNKGNVVIDKPLGLYDGSLWGTNYLLEGVIGSIT